ncbi:MAG: msrA2 [Phycisphaerales bacterium]|nr:msrA2 [Phycisphaerales bacterium]
MRALKWMAAGVAAAAVGLGAYQLRVEAKPEAAAAARASAKEAVVKVVVFNKDGKLVGPVESPRVTKSDDEWRKQLGPATFAVVRAKGTERPFCGTLLDNHKDGVYACVGCGLPLFASDAKFNSGTGWPSFFKPVGETNVAEDVDESHGMRRVEILCARCDSHLGHVFEDGPAPTGRRHCVNSESLKFFGKDELAKLADPAAEQPGAASAEKPAAAGAAATRPATRPAGG